MFEAILTIVAGVLSLNAAIILFLILIGGGLVYGPSCRSELYSGRRQGGVALIALTGVASVLSLAGVIEPRWLILAVCAPQALIGMLVWRNMYWVDRKWHAGISKAGLEA